MEARRAVDEGGREEEDPSEEDCIVSAGSEVLGEVVGGLWVC